MSTEQSSVDPELVEQTKQQIRNLVREIAQIAKSPTSVRKSSTTRCSTASSRALAAVGGAVWTLTETGQLALDYHINLRETRLDKSEEDQVRHGRLLRKVITSGEGMLVAPHSGGGDAEEGGNPTDYLLVLGPLKTANETAGVIEVFQRPSSEPQRAARLSAVPDADVRAGQRVSQEPQAADFTDRQALWAQLENFTRLVHKGLDRQMTAYTIANEGRRLIECDRVSVAINKGRKCVIEAVSGQDTFDKRSNTVTLSGRPGHGRGRDRRNRVVHGRHLDDGPAGRRGRAGVRRRVPLEGRGHRAAEGAARRRRTPRPTPRCSAR